MIWLFSIFIMSKMLISCRLSHAVIMESYFQCQLRYCLIIKCFSIFFIIFSPLSLSLSPSDILLTFLSFTHKPTILIWKKEEESKSMFVYMFRWVIVNYDYSVFQCHLKITSFTTSDNYLLPRTSSVVFGVFIPFDCNFEVDKISQCAEWAIYF